ncbi:UNVERIFIED_CONTAM: hypothetical protein Sradi_1944700 [Sesamum radiatum]|uniref:Tf2-1-like SH3-like domain-containing protein n=1 Tax=Sesamum radiatum TaxID=300843 RepID=A0AAW2TEU1_SESRA
MENIFKFHGMLKLIVSDRDPVFMSRFWREYFQLQWVQLKPPPPTTREQMVKPRLLINASDATCIVWKEINLRNGHTGCHLRMMKLTTQEAIVRIFKEHLHNAQHIMKVQADKKRGEREFAVGDLVFVKLRSYKQTSLKSHSVHKLTPKFFGPFKVLQHVILEPEVVLDRCLVKRNTQPTNEVLVKCYNAPSKESSWENLYDLQPDFPTSVLEDKDVFGGGNLQPTKNKKQERRNK